MCRHSLYGNREVSWLTKAASRDWSASGRRGAEADDARPREVRLRHSSDEVAEQNQGTGSGGDGAKGGGRGEREPATHAPDTEPGKRVTDAGARTDGRKVLPSLSEVGAGCGYRARLAASTRKRARTKAVVAAKSKWATAEDSCDAPRTAPPGCRRRFFSVGCEELRPTGLGARLFQQRERSFVGNWITLGRDQR